MFNNREIAFVFWLIAFSIFALSKTEIRASLKSLIKIILSKQILLTLMISSVYVFIILYMLAFFGLWDTSLIKASLLWYFGSYFMLLVGYDNAIKEKHYLRNLIKKAFTLTILIEYLVNVYVFPLLLEFFLLPVITFLYLISAYSESNEKYQPIKAISDWVIGIIGICIIISALSTAINNPNAIIDVKTIQEFFLPIILTILFIPFIFLLALYSIYEVIFLRFDVWIKDRELSSYAKFKLLITYKLSLGKLSALHGTFYSSLGKLNSKHQIAYYIKDSTKHSSI